MDGKDEKEIERRIENGDGFDPICDDKQIERQIVIVNDACPSRDGMAGDPHAFERGICVFCGVALHKVGA
jgi:hypothetical protein